jgi:hypothetical protein
MKVTGDRSVLMNPIAILMLMAMFGAAAALTIGVIGFLAGGSFNARYGNLLMRARVGLQLIAVLLLGLLFMMQS